MWPLPSSAAIPIGNPFVGLSLVEVFAVATILLAGAAVFLFVRMTRVGPEFRVVQCPLDGRRVRTLIGRSSAGTPLRIVYCSKWRARRITCDKSCLPKAA